ncbi:MAG: CDP-alcohol phosphatidyltransferase family protein [Spirochaetaceae bacterium]
MTAATLVSSLRLVLAPLFAVFYFLPIRADFPHLTAVILLWVILALVEISDLVDGRIARDTQSVTDLGKVYDPFADVIARMTYFTCFILSGVMPLWTFIVIMYREFAVLFLRMRLSRLNVALGAKLLGKAKSFTYFLSTVVALAFVTLSRLDVLHGDGAKLWYQGLDTAGAVVFAAAAVLSGLSFLDYLRVAVRHERTNRKSS